MTRTGLFSSSSTRTASPLRCGTSTGTISSLKRPSAASPAADRRPEKPGGSDFAQGQKTHGIDDDRQPEAAVQGSGACRRIRRLNAHDSKGFAGAERTGNPNRISGLLFPPNLK